MTRPFRLATALLALLVAPMGAQEHGAPADTAHAAPTATAAPTGAEPAAPAAEAKHDIITPHITNGAHLEIPWPGPGLVKEIHLPHTGPVFHIGSFTVDLSPTKHVVMLIIVAVGLCLVLISAANAHKRRTAEGKPPKGLAGAMEALILYMRDEVILPNVGHHGEGFVPYLLTMFFFILSANLLGLIPYASTATGNIAVTATLAIMTFLVIEISGMRALGKGYISTIIYWPHDMPLYMRIPISLIISPVELLGKFIKPTALAIRLFANMTAGHIVVLALVGLIFTFGSWLVVPAPLAMATAIMFLELMVAFLQAFIFTLLSSVFIGLVRESHH